jgi:hypothetical protein|tara:strand:+ start:263 stop:439 length:177 start_codon:yes stop_codon:yes gene_type:complete
VLGQVTLDHLVQLKDMLELVGRMLAHIKDQEVEEEHQKLVRLGQGLQVGLVEMGELLR